jgi:thiol-disulfide isomerase/thioredoxin
MPEILLEESGKKPTPEQDKKFKAEDEKLTKSLAQEYEALAKQHPDKAVYPWALGQLYDESNPLKQEEYCQQSVHIDAKFAPGYECLSDIANLRGDEKQTIEFKRKVMELEPDNADQAFYYAEMFESDPTAYKEEIMQFVKKFPVSPRSAQALYWYADRQKTDDAKIEAFEQLRKQFAPAKFDWSEDGVENLFSIYDRADPEKAQALAHEMLNANPKDKDWIARVAYGDTMAKAEQEMKENNPTAGLATLQTVTAPGRQFDMRRKELLQARALDAAGKTTEAYSALLTSYAKHPTDEIHTAMVEYGTRLGKTSQEVDAAIWSAIEANATPAIPFSLQKFTDDSQVSLAGYKGHVVIVDFWYPNCGPCRASFPYLQQLASKYKDKGVVVLAINGMEGQAAFVLPLMRSKGYDFIPLKGNEEWASNVYHVRGYPSTFLIGEDGRLYFKPHVYDDMEERATELEIEELLTRSGQ